MRFRPGHVLYGSRRTYLRKVAVADFEGITANTTFVIEPKDTKVLMPELLPFLMQTESFHEHSVRQRQ
jgi:type I restriction enzyme S subunit